MFIGIPTKKAKAETETYPLIAKTNIRNCSMKFGTMQTFHVFFTY